jgi:hypothetical protein
MLSTSIQIMALIQLLFIIYVQFTFETILYVNISTLIVCLVGMHCAWDP